MRYAKAYIKQCDPEARAEALRAFTICPYPEDPIPVIEDASSGNEKLRETAWYALEKIRHSAVREFALSKLQDDTERALPIFIKNYESSDSRLLETLVKSIVVDFECSTFWHWIHLDILGMIEDGNKAPVSLLEFIYEVTYCSSCRESVLRQMGRRRMLTDEILQECFFDSNDDIRAYARQCIRRRKRNSK